MKKLSKEFKNFLNEDEGQISIEMILIIVGLVLVLYFGFKLIGQKGKSKNADIADELSADPSEGTGN